MGNSRIKGPQSVEQECAKNTIVCLVALTGAHVCGCTCEQTQMVPDIGGLSGSNQGNTHADASTSTTGHQDFWRNPWSLFAITIMEYMQKPH